MRLLTLARTRGIERQLERIANYLEILVNAQGYATGKPSEKAPEDEGAITWTDQDIIDELERMAAEGKADDEIERRIQIIEDARRMKGSKE